MFFVVFEVGGEIKESLPSRLKSPVSLLSLAESLKSVAPLSTRSFTDGCGNVKSESTDTVRTGSPLQYTCKKLKEYFKILRNEGIHTRAES